jgi:uncharacterized protein YebE (UPF0316 family)
MAMATRGRKRTAATVGALGAVVQVIALAQVVTSLDRPANIDGYAVGVAAGVYLGVAAGSRLAADPIEHRVVVSGDGTDLADQLRTRGWSVTSQPAAGLDGAATVLFVVASADTTARSSASSGGSPRTGSAPAC